MVICPGSCGKCPPRPRGLDHTGETFHDPSPVRTHGGTAAAESETEVEEAAAAEEEKEEEARDVEEEHEEEAAEKEEEEKENGNPTPTEDAHCIDDPAWKDTD